MKYAKSENVLVAIPVFNERKYVEQIVGAVREFAENILVVDDGSDDGTGDILSGFDFIEVISHCQNMGYGQSLIDVFGFAARRGFTWVITIDCDFQHEPYRLSSFFKEIAKGNSDIISGSRYLIDDSKGLRRVPKERLMINRKITALLNSELGLGITDAFCGFKAYRLEAVRRLELTEKGYGLPLQLWICAAKEGLKIREIAVPLIYHNTKRHFSGDLEQSFRRYKYYLEIIRKELLKNGCKTT